MKRPRISWLSIFALMLLLGVGIVITVAAQQRTLSPSTAETLMGAALHQEEVEGNLEAAVATYKQVIADPRASRALAATALLHLGRSYEKLGDGEARKTYERVVREFADQSGSAAAARARLAALTAAATNSASSEPVRRRILADFDRANFQALSPDGRYSAGSDHFAFAIKDLQTGDQWRVRQGDSESGGNPEGESAWSRDGKYLAYNWEYRNSTSPELRVTRFDGSGDRLLYRDDDVEHIDVYDWTPDGKHVLTGLQHRDRFDIAFLSAANGAVRVVTTLKTRIPLALSPDGAWIAYDNTRSRPRDVLVVAADGTREGAVVQSPADDFIRGWSPDGRSVLFGSSQSGPIETWSVPVLDGKPAGNPEILRLGLGQAAIHRITETGRLYYSISVGGTDIYLGALEPATGKIVGALEPLPTRHATATVGGVWSPDGRQLAYRTTNPTQTISIFSTDTGEERDIRPNNVLEILETIRWTRDGSALLITARAPGLNVDEGQLYRLEVESEELRLLVRAGRGEVLHAPDLSSDGKTLYSLVDDRLIRAQDLDTGEQRTLYGVPPTESISDLTLSPVGGQLAVRIVVKDTGAGSLRILPVRGGEPQVVIRTNDPPVAPNPAQAIGSARSTRAMALREIAWSADGRHLFFTKVPAGGGKEELWRVAVQGGTEQPVGLTMDTISAISLHPGGKRFAVTAGRAGKWELWMMEHSLRPLTSR